MHRFLLVLLCLCAALPASADDAATRRLGELLQSMRQSEATFSQKVFDERGDLLQASSGSVLIQQPARFRWETREPFGQLLVCDGTTVWQYDPDLRQVVVRPLDKRADQLPSLLLSGDIAAVQQLFEVRLASAGGGSETFELSPREAGGAIGAFTIGFAGGKPARLVLSDGLGQRTEVQFEGVRGVETIDPAQFRFVTPEGVDELVDE